MLLIPFWSEYFFENPTRIGDGVGAGTFMVLAAIRRYSHRRDRA